MADRLDLVQVDDYASLDATVYGDNANQLMTVLLQSVYRMQLSDPEEPGNPDQSRYEIRVSVSLVTNSSTRRKRSRRNPSVRLPSKIVMTVEE